MNEIDIIKLAWRFCDCHPINDIIQFTKNEDVSFYEYINNILIVSGIDKDVASAVTECVIEHYGL